MINKGKEMKEQQLQIKFPVFNHEEDLESIADALECNILIPKDTLKQFIFRLRKIDSSLTDPSDSSLLDTIEKKRSLVAKLSQKCDHLRERNTVISFAEEAEAIANNSPFLSDAEVKDKVDDLRARLDGYVDASRPSKNNMKFLRFAEALLQKAQKHEAVLGKSEKKESLVEFRENSPGEISLEAFALAESLYELAATLYQGKTKIFESMLEKGFSGASKKEIRFHASILGGSLSKIETEEDRIKVISALLGFAHITTDYYAKKSPYPTIKEIKELFSHEFI